jgi:hypothetical protein
VVTPPWTGERPRTPGVSGMSGGQSQQALTRGSAQSRMQTCSLRPTSREPGRTLGELTSLGEDSSRPQPRAPATKDTGEAGLFPLRRASSTARPGLPYSAYARPPALHSFANASGGRRLAPDGRKRSVEEQTAQTWPSVLRTAPPRRFRTPSRPVRPAVCRRGVSTPHACIVQSAGDSSACWMVSRARSRRAGLPTVVLLYARTSNVLDTFRGRRRRLKRSLPDGWRPRCAYVAPHHTVPARGRG